MPAGEESSARAFYSGVLGLVEEIKPENLARRGGVWFRGGHLRLHLGVDRDFHPAGKAHPAILVSGLAELAFRSPDLRDQKESHYKGTVRCFFAGIVIVLMGVLVATIVA